MIKNISNNLELLTIFNAKSLVGNVDLLEREITPRAKYNNFLFKKQTQLSNFQFSRSYSGNVFIIAFGGRFILFSKVFYIYSVCPKSLPSFVFYLQKERIFADF
jgi:hypothetical protein